MGVCYKISMYKVRLDFSTWEGGSHCNVHGHVYIIYYELRFIQFLLYRPDAGTLHMI
jgi:hypothetical protein